MNLFGVLGVSGSALSAERVRAEITASNMANAETTRTADGKLFQRQHVIFQSAGEAGNDATPPGLLGGSFATSFQTQLANALVEWSTVRHAGRRWSGDCWHRD